ncbi:MAG: exosortase H [Pseudomonadota bacterium]
MTRFVVVFIALLGILFTVELLDPVQAAVVQPFTGWLADISAAILTVFDDQVRSAGRVISHAGNGFAVSIEAGCNGVEAAIVLIAGVIAFPSTVKSKVYAIVLGFLAIQVMNILRIISLFYLGQWNLDLFTYTHLYIWPVLIMLDVLIVFLLYLRWVNRSSEPVASTLPA